MQEKPIHNKYNGNKNTKNKKTDKRQKELTYKKEQRSEEDMIKTESLSKKIDRNRVK